MKLAHPVPILRIFAAKLMPWGSRDLTIADPFGNRITFTEPAKGA